MSTYILVDCNNFFASCERVFRPDLQQTPIVVLSNNDGCVVARSQEVKDAGIKMGVPYFKVKDELTRLGAEVFSSNFTLYADMSDRVFECLKQFSPDIEQYSIDECFLKVTDNEDIATVAQDIRREVFRATSLPVGVGYGATKTQAKMASHYAKTSKRFVAGFDEYRLNFIGDMIDVGEIWGIGRRHSKTLKRRGIATLKEFLNTPEDTIKKLLHMPGLRTYLELKGVPCYDLDSIPQPKKSILSSRSFGTRQTTRDAIFAALSHNICRAAERLRKQGSAAYTMTVFIRTSPFSTPRISNSKTITFPTPTDSSPALLKAAKEVLKTMYRPGYEYAKSGVLLSGIVPADTVQDHLFAPKTDQDDAVSKLMKTVDGINAKWGRGTIDMSCTTHENDTWKRIQGNVSPRYTTSWMELPVVKI
jgi:DNA polymerase V